jgi:PAS domain S-box-containing protein
MFHPVRANCNRYDHNFRKDVLRTLVRIARRTRRSSLKPAGTRVPFWESAHVELDFLHREPAIPAYSVQSRWRIGMTNERVRPPELFAWNDHAFRLFVESVKDYAIFMLDPQGRVVTWNAGAQRIKGYRPEEILGAHFSRFYLPEDVAQDKPAHELEIACRLGRFEDEGWRVRKDGSRFLANVLLTPLRDPEGRLYGFGKITRDVTGRRTAEAQVFELAEELRRAKEADLDRMNQLRLKDEFLCHVSHEFRAPLASIYSFTTLIADRLAGATTPKQDEYLAIILKNIRQLQAMIEDLLEAPQAVDGTLKVEAQFTPSPTPSSMPCKRSAAPPAPRPFASPPRWHRSCPWPAPMPCDYARCWPSCSTMPSNSPPSAGR